MGRHSCCNYHHPLIILAGIWIAQTLRSFVILREETFGKWNHAAISAVASSMFKPIREVEEEVKKLGFASSRDALVLYAAWSRARRPQSRFGFAIPSHAAVEECIDLADSDATTFKGFSPNGGLLGIFDEPERRKESVGDL